jgi:hypothetical protein
MLRTEKSCGPDAPTLASSLRRRAPAQPGQTRRQSASDGGKQARSPGRARRKPLKPLRREGRVSRRTLGDYARVLHLDFAREAAGAWGTRLSLRPLLSEGQKFGQTSDAWRRENAGACLISTNAPYSRPSSPGLTGRPSIPERLMIEPKSRGVLDRPVKGDDNSLWKSDLSAAAQRAKAEATRQSIVSSRAMDCFAFARNDGSGCLKWNRKLRRARKHFGTMGICACGPGGIAKD